MATLLPVGVVLASVTLTYFMCIRPMRQGRCVTPPSSDEMANLRREIASLRDSVQAEPPELTAHPARDTGQ